MASSAEFEICWVMLSFNHIFYGNISGKGADHFKELDNSRFSIILREFHCIKISITTKIFCNCKVQGSH